MIHWFWSDPHFNHRNIIEFCDRPFKDLDEMNEYLIQQYNKYVKPNQTCLWGGDCFFQKSTKPPKQIMDRLNGKKLLILGNHDDKPEKMVEYGFDYVFSTVTLEILKTKVLIAHYPYANDDTRFDTRYLDRRPQREKGQILIHGHTHSKLKKGKQSIHIGVDAWDYTPASMDEIMDIVKELKDEP